MGWPGLFIAFVKLVMAYLFGQGLAKFLEKKKPRPDNPGVKFTNVKSNTEPIKLIYGITRVNINFAYVGTTGTNNDYLHIIGILGEGPISGIVRQDGSLFSSTATQFPTSNPPKVYFDGELWTQEWSTRAYMEFFDGSASQNVCASLAAQLPEWTDCLRYTAYVYIRLQHSKTEVNIVPDMTFVVQGLELYDPLLESVQVSNNNNSLVAYDMLTRPSSRGGLGLDTWMNNPISGLTLDDLDVLSLNNEVTDPNVDLTVSGSVVTYWTDNAETAYSASGGYNSGPCMTLLPYTLGTTSELQIHDSGTPKYISAAVGDVFHFVAMVKRDSSYNGTAQQFACWKYDNTPTFLTSDVTAFTIAAADTWELVYGKVTITTATGLDTTRVGIRTINQTAGILYIDRLYISKTAFYSINGPRIDITWIEESRSYVETKAWGFDAAIDEDVYFADNFQLVLDCARLGIIFSETAFKLRFKDMNYETTVMDITEDDIISTGTGSSLTIRPPGTLFDMPNTIEAEFSSSALKYLREVLTYNDQTALLADGDERKETVDLRGLDIENAQKMVYYLLERIRWGNLANMSVRDRCLSLEPMDLVTLTHSMPGWSQQTFRVNGITFHAATQTLMLECQQDKIALYDDNYDVSTLQQYNTTLPRASEDVGNVINVVVTEVLYYYRRKYYTKLVIAFDPPNSSLFWKEVEVWTRTSATDDYTHQTNVTSDYEINPVEEGKLYDILLRSVNVYGKKEDLSVCRRVTHTVLGVTGAPSDLASLSAIASNDAINLYATRITDPDIDGYEVRLGTAWDGGIFMSFTKAPNLSLVGVQPGTHTFWMSPVRIAVDGTYIYSDNPVSVTKTVYRPPGFTLSATWTWDFTTGTFTFVNCEHVIHESTDSLVNSHDTELVADSGMELDDGSWSSFGSPTTHDQVGSGVVTPHGGSYSRRIIFDAELEGAQSAQFAVIEDETYDITVWVYPTGSLTSIQVNVLEGDASSNAYSQNHTVTADQWNQITATVTPSITGDTSRIRVLANGQTTGTFYIDDVSVAPQSPWVGVCITPQYDLTSIQTVRCWGEIDTDFVSSDTTFNGVGGQTMSFDQLGGQTDSFNQIFEPTQAGQLHMILEYSTDGSNWKETTKFEILCGDVYARYLRLKIKIIDPTADSNLYLYEVPMNAYTGIV